MSSIWECLFTNLCRTILRSSPLPYFGKVFVFTVACVLWMMCPNANADEARLDKKPNVVFFLVDDLGAMDIGAYNASSFYETPNIDRLARSGMQFMQGYAASCVCSPTRFSIMTGKYPARNKCTDWFGANRAERFRPAPNHARLDLNEVTVAEAFREAGYKTAFLGKWHLGPTEEYWPDRQGFDVNIGGCHLGHPPSYFSPYKNPRLDDGPQGEFLTSRLADEATRLIDDLKDEPFFLYFSFYQVHTPLSAPKQLIEKYKNKANNLKLRPDTDPIFEKEEQAWPTDDPRLVRCRQTHAVYAAMVESMDTAVGRVMNKIEEEGLAENTIFVFVSDNGGLSTAEGAPTSNYPLRGGKGWLYEGGHRVAFVIKAPGCASGKTKYPAITNDFYPTLLDLAGLPLRPQQHLDGQSLKSVIEGKDAPPREPLFWHYPHYSNQGGFPGGAMLHENWKLIRRYEDGRLHLYNLEADPSELDDQAKKQPERVKKMAEQLDGWLQSANADFLRPKDGKTPWHPKSEQ